MGSMDRRRKAAALGILYFFMPETRDQQFLNPLQGAPSS
jgi:hypothetical protein